MKTRRELSRDAALCVYAIFVALLVNAGPANAAKIWNAGEVISYPAGNWGGDPTIDGGAAILVDHFDTVYAATSGVIVGSPSGYTMIFTDTSSVLAYMPPIGPYGALNGSVLNPLTTVSGSLGGEVLALEFNVDFSDAGFLVGTSGIPFGDLYLFGFPVSSPLEPLNGLTVRQFLGIMNTMLGGGTSAITIDDLGTTLVDVNGSFFGGQPQQFAQDHLLPPAVPEPSSWVLLAFGGVGLGALKCAAFGVRCSHRRLPNALAGASR